MPKMFAEADLDAFQRLRCSFDPAGLANPGKLMPTPRLCGEVPGPVPAASAGGRRDWRSGFEAGDRPGGGDAAARASSARCGRSAAARSRGCRRATRRSLETGGLDRILEHNVGDFTAVLEAGVPFAEAQATFAEHGQRLAWDPPDPGGATIGGIVATADSGPLRHRYGGVRDLVVGTTVVLCDGTVAKSGGKVIKNVAGYDLAKLFAGSFGTLGLIATGRRAAAPAAGADRDGRVEHFDDPDALLRARARARAAAAGGRLLRRRLGRRRGPHAGAVLAARRGVEQAERIGDAGRRRLGRRCARCSARDGVVLKVSGRPTDLPDVIRAAGDAHRRLARRARAVVDRAAETPSASRRCARRSPRAPARCSTAPTASAISGPTPAPAQVVMERLKARFDPARIFRPGAFVGGI